MEYVVSYLFSGELLQKPNFYAWIHGSVHICTVCSTNTNLTFASRWTVKQTKLQFH